MKKTVLKALAMSAIAIALVVASVLGTMAYFTASSAVSNVFTVGDVAIEMRETKVDMYGVPVENAEKVDSNSYRLIAGKTYTKDPTIYVKANSEESYLFLKVRNDLLTVEDGYNATPGQNETMFGTTTMRYQLEANGWRFHHENKSTGVRVYVLCGTDGKPLKIGGTASDQEIPTFTSFTVDKDATQEQLKIFAGARVDLVAYAIQADGFVDDDGYDYSEEFDDPAYTKVSAVDRAWEAIVGIYPYENGVSR